MSRATELPVNLADTQRNEAGGWGPRCPRCPSSLAKFWFLSPIIWVGGDTGYSCKVVPQFVSVQLVYKSDNVWVD